MKESLRDGTPGQAKCNGHLLTAVAYTICHGISCALFPILPKLPGHVSVASDSDLLDFDKSVTVLYVMNASG